MTPPHLLSLRRNQRLVLSVILCLQVVHCTSAPGSDRKAASFNQEPPRVLEGHRTGVTSVCFSPDGRWLASGGFDSTVRIWNAKTWKTNRILNGHTDEVFTVVFSPDGRYLASSGFDQKILVWEPHSGKRVLSHTLPAYSTAVDLSPNGLLAIGTRDGDIFLIEISTGNTLRTWKNRLPEIETVFPIYSLSFAPDGEHLATGGPIILWNTKTGEQVKRQLRPGGVHDLAFSPHGQMLASAHWGGMARLWDLTEEKLIHSLEAESTVRISGPSGTVNARVLKPLAAVAFSPDGKLVATGGADTLIRLWDVTSGNVIQTLEGHAQSVVGLSFSPDGQSLASCCLDGFIFIWKLSPERNASSR